MFTVLLVEDNQNTQKLMTAVLTNAGYNVVTANNGEIALKRIAESHVDIILADVMMPVMDGVEMTKRLRECGSQLPIIMVTAKGTHDDKMDGFYAGADDYVTKPIDEDELLVRMRALLRRAKIVADRKLTVGSTILNYEDYTVYVDGVEVSMPRKEFLLLFKLLSYPNKIYTRNDIMADVWGDETDSIEQTVNVHINRLRTKFETNPDFEIVTVRGLGYKAVLKQ